MKIASYLGKTDQGPTLQLNEDGFDVDLKNHLFFVADCFGGTGIGDQVWVMVKETVKSFYAKTASDPDATLPFFFSSTELVEGNALINAIKQANVRVMQLNSQKPLSKRGGASILAMAVADHLAIIVSIGNCAAYLVRNGKIQLLTPPHSYEDLAGDHTQRPYLTLPVSALGVDEEPVFKVKEFRYQEGDYVLMMTDGVYSRVVSTELEYLFNQGPKEVQEKIKKIFALTNGRGNQDNQTMLCIRF